MCSWSQLRDEFKRVDPEGGVVLMRQANLYPISGGVLSRREQPAQMRLKKKRKG